jgi:hypothetical protein
MEFISAILWFIGGLMFGGGLITLYFQQSTAATVEIIVGALLAGIASGLTGKSDPDEYIH